MRRTRPAGSTCAFRRRLFQEKHGVLSPTHFPGHPASVSPDTERFLVVPVAAACSKVQQVAHSLIQAVQSSLPEGVPSLTLPQALTSICIIYAASVMDNGVVSATLAPVQQHFLLFIDCAVDL